MGDLSKPVFKTYKKKIPEETHTRPTEPYSMCKKCVTRMFPYMQNQEQDEEAKKDDSNDGFFKAISCPFQNSGCNNNDHQVQSNHTRGKYLSGKAVKEIFENAYEKKSLAYEERFLEWLYPTSLSKMKSGHWTAIWRKKNRTMCKAYDKDPDYFKT